MSKKWVFIMGKRLDKNAAPAPAKKSGTSAQDRNHTTSSLPQQTRSNAYPDKRIWMKGPHTLNPLNWHCFRFALGHHLFQHTHSPYDEEKAQDVAKLLPRMKEQASAATTTTHPLFMAPFTSKELKLEIQKLLPDQSQCTSGITNPANATSW